MQQYTKIAVIGGTGKAGKYLVNQLIQKGFRLKLLLRNPEKFLLRSPFIEIIKGDAKNLDNIRSLLVDTQAVISTLGMGTTPEQTTCIFSQATQNIVQAMHEYNVQRYVVITGLNVDTPLDKKATKSKYATDWMYTNYPKTTTDKQVEYSILANSNVDWTLVRLPLIELTDNTNEVKISIEDCLGDKISATDLANFLINQLIDNQYIKQAPFIANV